MFSNCPKCGNSSFKVVTQEPYDSHYKLNFVQCSSCNSPVGVLEYYNAGALLQDQKKMIQDLGSELSDIHHKLQQVIHLLQHR